MVWWVLLWFCTGYFYSYPARLLPGWPKLCAYFREHTVLKSCPDIHMTICNTNGHSPIFRKSGQSRGGPAGWVFSVGFRRGILSTAHSLEKLLRVKTGDGVETLHFAKFWQKYGPKYDIFHILLKYRGRNNANFPRPEKGGSKWRSISNNLDLVSTLPGFRGQCKDTEPDRNPSDASDTGPIPIRIWDIMSCLHSK